MTDLQAGSEFGMEPQGEKRYRAAGEIIAGIVDKLIIGGDVDSVGDASGWRSKLDMQPHRADRHWPAHVIVTGIGDKLIVEAERGPIGHADGIIGFDD
jgi:hypothetical protein